MKRLFWRILLGIGILVLIAVVAGGIHVNSTVIKLPSGTDEIIDQVMQSEIPELVKGQSGLISNDGVQIWYESIEPSDSIYGTVLLFMGIGSDALAWPEYFTDPIVERGYRVIRFDNRGTGMSDWVKDWQGKGAYSLDDMAADGIAVLDTLGIDQFHAVGVSLGGMIAQQAAINYNDRVLSLTSMMSSAYIEDPELPGISMDIMKKFIKIALRYGVLPTERNTIKLNVAARSLLIGETKYNVDIRGITEEVLYNLRNRKGYNSTATQQQSAAVSESGSRYSSLKKLKCPTLVIHGTTDPLMPFVHGKKTAEIIPGAETLWVEGMGHDVPEIFTDTILTRIFNFWESSN
ncbi:MAG: alpha/beta hydrolase [Bacteroidia bacterium]|nr:alpha/beta hydrolase [Bacteroidia bacterium]